MGGTSPDDVSLLVDVTVPLDRFELRVTWKTTARASGVFGHSGAGKTTLLETLAGLRRDARGLIRVNGVAWLDSSRGVFMPPERRGVGYVPQDALLFPHRDVMGNLLAGRRRAASGPGRGPDPGRVLEVLELGELRDRGVESLSGGEKQRVALGRALCSGPGLLLLDEPFAGLDQPLRRRILPYLVRVRDEFGLPSLYVSHDATELRTLTSDVLVLSAGRVIATGSPEKVFMEASVLPMARLEGFDNVLRGRVIGCDEATALLEIEPGLVVRVPGRGLAGASEAVIATRAEDLILATQQPSGLSAQNILAGVIREIREPGASEGAEGPVLAMVGIGARGLIMVVAITRQAWRQLCLAPGVDVHIIFKTQACRILAP
jgi:molybdate transport system ATP-binding protein